MTSTDSSAPIAGALVLTSLIAMIASAAIVVPSGLTLNPADPTATLAAVHDRVGLHLAELGLDVLGWLALTAAGLLITAIRGTAAGVPLGTLPGGLLAAAGLTGLLHDAGNLAVTQLAARPRDAAVVAAATAILLTAKWTVNLAGLLWSTAAVATTRYLPMPNRLRRAGGAAALCGLAAVALPWTTGIAGPSPAIEQLGYGLHLPVMIWYAALGRQFLIGHGRPISPG